MKLRYFYILLFVFLVQFVKSQDLNSSFYTRYKIDEKDSTKLFFSINNVNFFKNNEYFGALTSGLTYIGTYLQPKLVYYPYSKVKIQAGVHLLKYSGLDTLSNTLPVFSFQYTPTDGIDFIMGTLHGAANHNLLEPMYAFENYLHNSVENGLQLLVHKPRFYADVWVNWEKFILKTSQSQESILGGIHSSYSLIKKGKESPLKLDVQLLIAHKGGQYHTSEETLQTLINSSFGIKYLKKVDSRWIQSVGTNDYYLTYNDASPKPQLPYLMGYAVSLEAFLNTKLVSLRLAYWSGEYYISSRGNPLFMSISEKYGTFVLPRTELLIAKLVLKKQLFKDIIFEARFEPYMDLQQNQFEFSYSVYLIFNRDFFLRKL